jgi:flagellar biosynthesis/type III secretory pathway chaperone
MNTKIAQLMELLDTEADCYRDMLGVLAAEKESISFTEKRHFDRIEQDKASLVLRIQACEKKRSRLVDQLAIIYKVDAPKVTVSLLARRLTAPDKERLLTRAEHLRSLMAEVQSKNKRNQHLIHLYLDLVKDSLKLLMHLIDDNAIYRKPGDDYPQTGYRSRGGRIFCGSV